MTRPSIKIEKREVLGRKVKKLRKEGLMPANIYGKNIASESVSVSLEDFLKIFAEAGESQLVDLKLGSEIRPVLIHNVQLDSVSDIPLHADFHQVSLKEKTTAMIPVELVGESPAVEQKIGILIQPISEVEVEALPTDLPEKITLDISGLDEVGKTVTLAEAKIDASKIEIKAGSELVVAKIDPLAIAEEEIAPPPAEEEAPAEGEVPVEGDEGKEETEAGETPSEGKNEEVVE